MPASIVQSTCKWIASVSDLQALVQSLQSIEMLAVDVEHHHLHSYLGFVCLLQLSTGKCSPRKSSHILAPNAGRSGACSPIATHHCNTVAMNAPNKLCCDMNWDSSYLGQFLLRAVLVWGSPQGKNSSQACLRYSMIEPFALPACNKSTNLQCMSECHMLYAELLRPILCHQSERLLRMTLTSHVGCTNCITCYQNAGKTDYLVDALALHDHMHLLRPIFADTSVLKVRLDACHHAAFPQDTAAESCLSLAVHCRISIRETSCTQCREHVAGPAAESCMLPLTLHCTMPFLCRKLRAMNRTCSRTCCLLRSLAVLK